MAAESRGLLRQVIKNFLNTLKPKKYWGVLVGRDYLGTEYYEIPENLQGSQRKSSRWFTPVSGNFEQKIPPEWEAWLRYRRKDPPTEEEIQTNIYKAEEVVRKAKEIEGNRTKTTQPAGPKSSFPSYREYEDNPGSKNL